MWQVRLPREVGEAAPKRSLSSLLRRFPGRLLLAAVPLLVVAAVVVGGFGLTLVTTILVAATLLILAAAALQPLWRRPRGHAESWWR